MSGRPIAFLGALFLLSLFACASDIAELGSLVSPSPELTPLRQIPADYSDSFDRISDPSSSWMLVKNATLAIEGKNAKTGSQALELRSLGGARDFGVEFPLSAIAGQSPKDITEWAINISVFIPKDSPVTKINFAFSAKGVTVLIPVMEKRNVKGRWFREGINLEEVAHNPKTIVYQGPWAQAISILKACESVSLIAQSDEAVPTQAARFLVDDLSYARMREPTVDSRLDSLRKYARPGLYIGTVLQSEPGSPELLDPYYWYNFPQEFSLAWIGTDPSWQRTKPESPATMDFDLSAADRLVAMAEKFGLTMKMFSAGWHVLLPRWLIDTLFNQLRPILENRMTKEIGRFSGKVYMWDVFNEPLYDDTWAQGGIVGLVSRQSRDEAHGDDFAPYGYKYSPWVDGQDTSIIKAAFKKARELDPQAKLFLNEYDNEEFGLAKSEYFFKLVTDMRREGVPVDGVGFEMHQFIWGDTDKIGFAQQSIGIYLANVDKNVKRYASQGILVDFSEVEARIRIDDLDFTISADRDKYARRLQRQAQLYSGLMRIAKENPNVVAFIFWVASDTWTQVADTIFYPERQVFGDGAPFDSYYQAKPAYFAMLNALKGK